MANEWASSVKESGVLRVGGTMTSQLFSLMDEKDGKVRGFDAGLFQLLARYIFGDETKCEITQVDAGSRESVLENGR
jgi:glutamate transport system substrate-binding protein